MNAICVGNDTPEKEPTTRCIFSANVKIFFVSHNKNKIIRTTLPKPHFPKIPWEDLFTLGRILEFISKHSIN